MTKKRKKHPKTVKARVAIEAIKDIKTMSELASEYNIHPNQISKWKKQLKKGAPELFERGAGTVKTEDEVTALKEGSEGFLEIKTKKDVYKKYCIILL